MTNKVIVKDNTYLENTQLLTHIGEDTFHKFTMKQSAHANRVGMTVTLLPLITKPFSP